MCNIYIISRLGLQTFRVSENGSHGNITVPQCVHLNVQNQNKIYMHNFLRSRLLATPVQFTVSKTYQI